MADYFSNRYFAPRYFGPVYFGGVTVTFPVQYSGLRYFDAVVKELCLVAVNDAPAGDQWRIRKGATTLAVYLVDPSDPAASNLRINTNDGIKAARLKT